jgi:hypothetical protein
MVEISMSEDNFQNFWKRVEFEKKLREEINFNLSLLVLSGLILAMMNGVGAIIKEESAFTFVFVVFITVAFISGFIKYMKLKIINITKIIKIYFVSNLKKYINKLPMVFARVYKHFVSYDS